MTLAFGVSMLIACGDSGTGERRSMCESDSVLCAVPNFEEDVLRPKLVGCAGDPNGSSCHIEGTGQSTMELDLTDPATSMDAAIGALIGQNGLGGPLVDTSCTDDSFLVTKLTSNPGGGSRMPLGGDVWSNDEIDCFRVYLNDTFVVSAEE